MFQENPRDHRTPESVQRLFGMLLGGLLAAFLGGVASLFFFVETAGAGSDGPLLPALFGVSALTLIMAAGVLLSDYLWLASTLLFASGFTGLWSIVASFVAEWDTAVLIAWGVAVVVGAAAGWLRFGRHTRQALPGEGAQFRGGTNDRGLSIVDPWDSGTSVSHGG